MLPRITVIEPSGALYGSEYCLLDILDGLRGKYQWHVATVANHGFDRVLEERAISFSTPLSARLNEKRRRQKFVTYWRLYDAVRRSKPHLIYLNQAGLIRVTSLIAQALRIPLVCQVQTLEDAGLVSGIKSHYRRTQAFICNSNFIAGVTHVPLERRCVLYQGILTGHVATALQERPSVGRIGILGRIAESKGHFLLLDAVKELAGRGCDVQVSVIGAGVTALQTEQYEKAIRSQGLERSFEMRGYRTDLAEELSRLDLLIIPSLAEPLGRVLFDAARHGVPVVASDGGGLGELCRHFEVGELFRTNDAESLALAILNSLENLPNVRQNFISAAEKMRRRLRMESYLESVDKILTCALNNIACREEWLGNES